MGKAKRKCLPEPPPWYLNDEWCWACPKENYRRGNCVQSKNYKAYLKEQRKRQEKELLRALAKLPIFVPKRDAEGHALFPKEIYEDW